MSFSGTPLGQGRRLDHKTFLNKSNLASRVTQPPVTSRPPNSPPKPAEPSIPTSYSQGAPTQTTRSPPKLSSSSSRDSRPDAHNPEAETSQDLPALARFARLKQRESASSVTEPNPSKWSVKDTSVQIANALQIAADDMSHYNPNDQWSSASAPNRSHVPRSTSVEYEKETQSTRALPVKPPSRGPPPARSAGAALRGLNKSHSSQYVPPSDEDEEQQRPARNERGKSPFEHVADLAMRTAFYLRAGSQEPQPGPSVTNGRVNGNGHHVDGSYDYAAEEAEFQKSKTGARPAPRKTVGHRRGGMSEDAKAYRPTADELEYSSEEVSDDGRPRRRKRKSRKDGTGGPLNTLPVTSYDKRRKKRKSKGDLGDGVEEEEQEEEEEQDDSGPEKVGEQLQSSQLQSSQRLSLPPPPIARKSSQPPSVRGSVPPEPQPYDFPVESSAEVIDTSLPSVQEEPEEREEQPGPSRTELRARSAYGAGGLMGRVVNIIIRAILVAISYTGRAIGRTVAISYDLVFRRPAKLIRAVNLAPFFTLLLIAAVGYGLLSTLRNTSLPPFFGGGGPAPVYQAPDVPASNIAEISARLQALENALAGLSLDTQQSKIKIESNARVHHDVSGRLEALQSQLQKESSRAADDRQLDRTAATQGLAAVRSEVESLRTMVREAVEAPAKGSDKSEEDKKAEDAVARARLEALEERVGTVEGGVRDALELGKNAVKVPGGGSSVAPPWWQKITRTGKPLQLKADGQDVTDVIGHLVDTAVTRRDLDGIGKADLALFSGGARVWPAYTSPQMDLSKDDNWKQKLRAMLFADGERVGLPPVVALHPDIANGRCWAFDGDHGQLGVFLARPAFIHEVTIDHVAPQLTWDARSAPRDMELWGLVEPAHQARVAEWEDERRRQRAEEGAEDEDEYVKYWSGNEDNRPAKFVRVARFEYDLNAGLPAQTFAADPVVRALDIDFGMVVLRVNSNWGQEKYTCLYRLRVHGEVLDPTLPRAADTGADA